jgi:hypothetical protein
MYCFKAEMRNRDEERKEKCGDDGMGVKIRKK